VILEATADCGEQMALDVAWDSMENAVSSAELREAESSLSEVLPCRCRP
jgi:hypothetical protein